MINVPYIVELLGIVYHDIYIYICVYYGYYYKVVICLNIIYNDLFKNKHVIMYMYI